MDIIEMIKNEKDPFNLRFMLFRRSTAEQFASLTTTKKEELFKQLGIEFTMSKEMLIDMLYVVGKSLAHPWNSQEDVIPFFELLFKIEVMDFPEFFPRWGGRMSVHKDNLKFMENILRACVFSELDDKWVRFLAVIYSDEQLKELPEDITSEANFMRAVELRNKPPVIES